MSGSKYEAGGAFVTIASLQGWLVKKKSEQSKKIISFLGTDTKRYFRVQEVKGIDDVELALCYFTTVKDENPRGNPNLSQL